MCIRDRDTIGKNSSYKNKDDRWPLLGSLRRQRHWLYSFQQDVKCQRQKWHLFSEFNSWNWPKEKKRLVWETTPFQWNDRTCCWTFLQQLPSHWTSGQSSHILYHGQPGLSVENALTKQHRGFSYGWPNLEQKRNMLSIPSKTWLAGVCFQRKYIYICSRHIVKITVWIQKKDIKQGQVIWTIFCNNRKVKAQTLQQNYILICLSFESHKWYNLSLDVLTEGDWFPRKTQVWGHSPLRWLTVTSTCPIIITKNCLCFWCLCYMGIKIFLKLLNLLILFQFWHRKDERETLWE